mgnify:CR=1 FL=1
MNAIYLLAACFLLAAVVSGAQIDPQADVLSTNADGEIIEIFGIDPWISDAVSFADPVAVQNGTAIIGRIFFAGALVPVEI